MIHTSDGESFEDEVGHVFGHDLMKDVADTKMAGNKADLEIAPTAKLHGKQDIENTRDYQDQKDIAFDNLTAAQKDQASDSLGLGPTMFDQALKDWGSVPLYMDGGYNGGVIAPGGPDGREGPWKWNQIAMEPFDPEKILSKPSAGGGGNVVPMRNPANQNNKEWTLIRNKTKGTEALENRRFEDIVKDMGGTLEEEVPLAAHPKVSPPMTKAEVDWRTRDRLGRTRARVDWSLERNEMPNELDLKMLKRYQNSHPEYSKGLEDLKNIKSISKDVNPRGFYHGLDIVNKLGPERFDLDNIVPLVSKPK